MTEQESIYVEWAQFCSCHMRVHVSHLSIVVQEDNTHTTTSVKRLSIATEHTVNSSAYHLIITLYSEQLKSLKNFILPHTGKSET